MRGHQVRDGIVSRRDIILVRELSNGSFTRHLPSGPRSLLALLLFFVLTSFFLIFRFPSALPELQKPNYVLSFAQ